VVEQLHSLESLVVGAGTGTVFFIYLLFLFLRISRGGHEVITILALFDLFLHFG
jgi:hypothetical protein